MSLIKDYFEKTKKHIDEYGELTMVLMQVGAFFEVYGLKDKNDNIFNSNIMDFSRICDLNVVDKKVCCGSEPVVMAGFKDHLLDKYVKKLQDSGYTIAVYEQDEQCANTTRSLTGVYSPGTYFSTDTENITNNTCCIWIENKKGTFKNKDKMFVYIGASIIDIFTGTTSIMEYKEQYIKNPCTFDELERFISIYNPSETIFISNLPVSEIDDIVSYANIKSKSLHIINLNDHKNGSKNIQRASNCEKQTYQVELLNKFYKINDINAFMGIFNDNVYATQSFCYLLDFIYQHNPNLIYKIYEPVLENDSKKLILANHSLKQLNIIEDDNYNGKYSCVVKMLNECITPMGKRKFTYNFLNPVTDETYLQEEYNITEKLLEIKGIEGVDEYKVVKTMLVHIKDISKIMRQIMLQKITPKSIYQLYNTICCVKTLYEFVIGNESLRKYLKKRIVNFVSLMDQIDRVLTYLKSVLILEDCKDIDNIQKIEKSFIQDGVDIELDNKIQTLTESQDQMEAIQSYFSNIISTYETGKKGKKVLNEDTKTYVKIHETEKNNFSLLATDRRCKILEEIIKDKKSVVLKYKSSHSNMETHFTLSLELEYNKQSASNKTITNQQISSLCKNVGSIKVNLIDTVSKVYQHIIKKLQDYQEDIQNIGEFITYVDICYAKALIAHKYNYCKPEIVSLSNEN